MVHPLFFYNDSRKIRIRPTLLKIPFFVVSRVVRTASRQKNILYRVRTATRAAPCNCDVTSNSQLRSLFTKHRIGPVRLSMSRENPLRPFSSSFFLLSPFFFFFPFSSFLLLSFFLLFLTSYLPPFLFLLPPSSAESLRP